MKIPKTYRLEKETIQKLGELTEIYQQLVNKESAIKRKVTMTDVVETLIHKEYALRKEIKQDEKSN